MPRILIIDDDTEMRSMLRRSLQRAGYEILEAPDGRSAIKSLGDHPVDLVITDLIMPEMEGVELVLSLRGSHPKLPVIAISGGVRLSPMNYLDIAQASGLLISWK